MENTKENSDKPKRAKMGPLKRIGTVASGAFMLHRAIKKRKLIKGIGAGYMIFRGVAGIGRKTES